MPLFAYLLNAEFAFVPRTHARQKQTECPELDSSHLRPQLDRHEPDTVL
jgi:hypothetical protein